MVDAWTDEDIAEAARRWKRGESAGTIAQAMGRTRNGVLGLMYRKRERFPLRDAAMGIKRAGRGSSPPAMPRPEARPRPVPVAKPAEPVHRPPAATQAPRPVAPDVVAATRPGFFAHRDRLQAGSAPVALVDRTTRQCAWPLTDFLDASPADMPCCGAPVASGRAGGSYCAAHAVLAVGQGTRTERMAVAVASGRRAG